MARGDKDAAVTRLPGSASLIENKIPYDEPPGWHAPVRQSLGAVLLAAGRAKEAEVVYREELARNPANGWSLKGLALALEQQNRREEAADVEKQLAKAWQNADVQLVASQILKRDRRCCSAARDRRDRRSSRGVRCARAGRQPPAVQKIVRSVT